MAARINPSSERPETAAASAGKGSSSSMERASRRSAASGSGAGSRRRRRDAAAEASQSDAADSDASSRASASKKRDASEHHRTRSSRRSATREEEAKAEEEEEEEEERGRSEPEDASSSSDKPARRERSLSNVSTTSSTSSGASEPHNGETRHARHTQKLGELEQKRKMVEDGTLAEYCRRVTEFKEDRNRLLQMAEWHKNLQLQNGQELRDFELQRAEHLWLHGKKVLKTEMIAKLDAVRAKLMRELEQLSKPGANLPSSSERADAASLSGKETKISANKHTAAPSNGGADSVVHAGNPASETPSASVESEPAQKKRKTELPKDLVRLSFDDISADLAAIAIERKGRSEVTNAGLLSTQMDPMKIDRRRLFCGKNIFQDGDEVAIVSPVTQEDYVGKISSVTDDAIYVRLSSGQKVRIYLDLIKSKRCELKPLLRGLPALVEYESY